MTPELIWTIAGALASLIGVMGVVAVVVVKTALKGERRAEIEAVERRYAARIAELESRISRLSEALVDNHPSEGSRKQEPLTR
jgi:hypothetical protein